MEQKTEERRWTEDAEAQAREKTEHCSIKQHSGSDATKESSTMLSQHNTLEERKRNWARRIEEAHEWHRLDPRWSAKQGKHVMNGRTRNEAI